MLLRSVGCRATRGGTWFRRVYGTAPGQVLLISCSTGRCIRLMKLDWRRQEDKRGILLDRAVSMESWYPFGQRGVEGVVASFQTDM